MTAKLYIRDRKRRVALCAVALLGATHHVAAQTPTPASTPPIEFDGRGVTIATSDGKARLNLRFRVQELLSATTQGETDYGIKRTQFTVRRMRLRLEGTFFDPRLKVNVQLAFSRADIDVEALGVANVLRDAYVSWQFTPNLVGVVGQTKLPGNRQLLVSSAELQHPDRSPLHATFTVDRDVGVFGTYARNVGRARFMLRGAITSGEGRNANNGDGGLAYTGRAELLPFGAFANNGDYSEGDLAREPSLKLSVAAGISRNDRAVRTGGQLGSLLYAARGMTTHFADIMLKRQGLMVMAEYAHRLSSDPVTRSGTSVRYVFAGEGVNAQASWLLPNSKWEPQLRFTAVTPAMAIRAESGAEALAEYSVGVARYINAHRIKVNGEMMHTRYDDLFHLRKRGEWTLRTGIEVGI